MTRVMMRRRYVMGFLAGALLAAGCGGTGGDEEAAPTSTEKSAAVADAGAPRGDPLFEDSFDDDRNGWGIVDDQFGTADYEDGDYAWELRGSVAHWLPAVLGEQYDAGELEMVDVVVRAEVTVSAGGGLAGVFCRENPDADAEWQWYEFVARDGYAAIRRADLEANLDVLAETDDVDTPLGEPMAIEARCVDDADGSAQLSLALNNTTVLSATDDDPLGNGVSGLQAWTFPPHEPMELRWHEFAIYPPAS